MSHEIHGELYVLSTRIRAMALPGPRFAGGIKCPEGGLDRIDAELAQELVLAWLRDVASNGQRFREFEAQGRKRIAAG